MCSRAISRNCGSLSTRSKSAGGERERPTAERFMTSTRCGFASRAAQGWVNFRNRLPISGEIITWFSEPTTLTGLVTETHWPAPSSEFCRKRKVLDQTGHETTALLMLLGRIRRGGLKGKYDQVSSK